MVEYEWDVEEVTASASDDYEEGEVLDHNHQGSYADCLTWIRDCPPPEGSRWEIVLVRDTTAKYWGTDRSWAYVENGKLPEFFTDGCGDEDTKVPKRFIKEVERA